MACSQSGSAIRLCYTHTQGVDGTAIVTVVVTVLGTVLVMVLSVKGKEGREARRFWNEGRRSSKGKPVGLCRLNCENLPSQSFL